MIRIAAIVGCICVAVAFSSCATRPRIYKAPDATKMNQAAKVHSEKVAKVRKSAEEARRANLEAKAAAEKLIVLSATVDEGLAKLKSDVPAELAPRVAQVETDHKAEADQEADTRAKLAETERLQTILEADVQAAEASRVTLQRETSDYTGAAGLLAQDATDERNHRIAAESQLVKQKLIGWLWKLGGGAVVIGIIALVVLWFTGKLAFKFAVILCAGMFLSSCASIKAFREFDAPLDTHSDTKRKLDANGDPNFGP